jgi:hypothetical protein
MKHALIYSLRVWLTTCVTVPIVWTIGFTILHSSRPEPFMIASVLFLILATAVFSSLTWFVFFLSILAIGKYYFNRARLTIFVIGEALVILSFSTFIYAFPGFERVNFMIMMTLHCLVVGAGIWLYKLGSVTIIQPFSSKYYADQEKPPPECY